MIDLFEPVYYRNRKFDQLEKDMCFTVLEDIDCEWFPYILKKGSTLILTHIFNDFVGATLHYKDGFDKLFVAVDSSKLDYVCG